MKIKSILLLFTSVILLSMSSCNEDDFNPRADWKDITIAYGFINPNESTHYVRVCKAFLGPGNALDLAKEPDSVYYAEDALTVTLKHYNIKNGSLKNTFLLNRVVLEDREPGVFPTKNIAYTFDHTFDMTVDKSDSLVLEMEIIGTGKIMRARTDFVYFGFPSNYQDGYTFQSLKRGNKSASIRLNAVQGVKMVEMYLTYHYGEAPAGTTDRDKFEKKTLIWKMVSKELENPNETLPTITYVPDDFFEFLLDTLEYNTNVVRINLGDGDFKTWAGSQDLYYYNNVNKPSGIVIDRPEYTNITSNTEEEDAYGIFTTRYDKGFKVFLPISIEDLRTIDRQFVQL